MRRVMVRYRVKPDQVAANEELVRAVYEELDRARPDGFRYATFASTTASASCTSPTDGDGRTR